MKASIAREPGGPQVLQLRDVETPVAGPQEILIKIVAAGVNRADILQRRGNYPVPPGASSIIGLECSGTVAALGAGVDGWQLGEPCAALLAGGGYAEYVAAPAAQVVRPPESLDLISSGGIIEVAATVTSNLDLVGLRAGETFLIHGGAGGIGSFAIQYAKAVGARVIATAGNDAKLALCRSLGADLAVSYHDDWAAVAKEFTTGSGVDVIMDSVGARYLAANVDALSRGGRLVIIGTQSGREATVDLGQLLRKNASITGTGLRPRPISEKAVIMANLVERVWPMIDSGLIMTPPETRIPLAEAARAHAQLESGDNLGKIILAVSTPSVEQAGAHG